MYKEIYISTHKHTRIHIVSGLFSPTPPFPNPRHYPVLLEKNERGKRDGGKEKMDKDKKASFRIEHTWTRIYICFYVYTMVITAHEVF